jgi:hypothetical protein
MSALLLDSPKPRLLLDFAKPSKSIPFPLREAERAFSIEAIQARVENITPLLEEILRSRPPIHWGINE